MSMMLFVEHKRERLKEMGVEAIVAQIKLMILSQREKETLCITASVHWKWGSLPEDTGDEMHFPICMCWQRQQ